jgi:Protein of unknown function (DUF2786)
MSREQVLSKVRKLLAMADKKSGATENEMMTARALAQALMLRHRLSPTLAQDLWRSLRHSATPN